VKEALHGRHFADDKELKQCFRDLLQSRVGNFTTLVYSDILNIGKSTENDKVFVEK
jgi:hypothetical protein